MATVELTQGFVAHVDAKDLALVSGFRWKALKARGHCYAARTNCRKGHRNELILMHRVIIGAAPGTLVDHKDGDGLNNRRNNLRIANYKQNGANTKKTRGRSKYKGVYWNKRDRKWRAQIGGGTTKDGRHIVIYLGSFDDERVAARAYDAKAIEMHGEFACPNFPRKRP